MLKKSRKILTAVVILTLIMAMAVQSLYGAVVTPPVVEPQWTNLLDLYLNINYGVSPMMITVMAQGYEGTVFSNATVTLKKLSGVDAGCTVTWSNLEPSGNRFVFIDSTITQTEGTYQITLNITATRNGYAEPISYSRSSTYSPS